MIIVRAPLRISFVGGGTDLADFYTKSPGRVLSAAIDKYVYVSVKHSPLIPGVHVRYSQYESVTHPRELKNDRIREALLATGITDHVEVSTFSDFPGNTGLGSSSSFAVALMKGLRLSRGDVVDARTIAEDASTLEIQVLQEPIGKQDQYASAIGGINVLQFNQDHSVRVEPLYLDYQKVLGLESHMLVFYTGITRQASSILSQQKAGINDRFKILERMAAMANPFRDALYAKDFRALGDYVGRWLGAQTAPS
jgi:D-glycero-alpha-D-manno-heptose-7-phosphate kinase